VSLDELIARSIDEAHARVTRCDHQECGALAAQQFVGSHIVLKTAGE
jgi:hypothetical protein